MKKFVCFCLAGVTLLASACSAPTESAQPVQNEPITVNMEVVPTPTPEPTPEPTPTPTPEPTLHPQEQRVKGSALSVEQATLLAGPAASYDEVGQMTSGQTADVLDRMGSYYQLDVEGLECWVQEGAIQVTLNDLVELPAIVIPDPDDFAALAPTTQMEFVELISDNGDYDYPEYFPEVGTYKVIVDVEHQVTMVYTTDENGEYTIPIRYMLCSTGANDCTPKGTFEMGSYKVRFSEFVRDGRYGQYWTQVRNAIYFHTTLYMSKDDTTYEDASWNKLGEMDSHGCIRLTVPDARWMWYNIAPNTICEIRDGDPNDTQTAEIRAKLLELIPKAPEERIDPDEMDIPYTDNWTVENIPTEEAFVQGSQEGANAGKKIG